LPLQRHHIAYLSREASIAATLSEGLTPRERETLALMLLGRDAAEVADEFGVAPETVKIHMRNVVDKLGAKNRIHAVVIALTAIHLGPIENGN
jgi:DNA-binding CsgD family transcriptional regulator